MNKKENVINRNINYDLIRFIAVLLIVLCHSIETIYYSVSEFSFQSKIFYIVSHTLSRLGVPLFLFLTGTLLINKNFDDTENIKKFYNHNFKNLVITCEIWYLVYYFFDVVIFKRVYNFYDFIPIMFFLKQYPLSHAWYIPMIVGIYITMPFVSIIVKKYINIIKKIIYVSIFYIFLIPFINILLSVFKINYYIPMNFNIGFGGGYYGIYIILGYLIVKRFNENIKSKYKNILVGIVFLVSFLITIFIRYKLDCDSWYSMFTILICSSCLFYLLLNIKISSKYKNILKTFSILAFGVYLVHKLIIDLFVKFKIEQLFNFKLPILVFIYFILTIVFSYIFVYILSKNKIFRKYLLFIK